MMTLRELTEHAADFARKAFKGQGYISPMWVGERPNGERIVIATDMDFNSAKEKDAAAAAVRHMLKEKGAAQYFYISEAWMVSSVPGAELPKDEQDKALELARQNRLKEHPDRREVVVVEASNGTETIMGWFYILRPEHGEPSLSPFEYGPQGVQSTGRLANMLNPEKGE